MVTRGHERPVLGDLATLATSDDFDAIRERYLTDEPLPVPPDITSFINGKPVEFSLAL